jgi:hypothetical protein
VGDFRRVDTDGRRNEEPLTEKQKGEAIAYAVALGMPVKNIDIVDGETGYLSGFDILAIGTDVLPLGEWSKNPNSNISLKGAIAHEIIGHREAAIKGLAQPIRLLEDVQASIRAARFAPDLSQQERTVLLKDALNRLRREKVRLRDVKNNLHINER